MALGDTITVRLTQAIAGYGDDDAVITLTETAYVEALIAQGWMVVVPASGAALDLTLQHYGTELAFVYDTTGTALVIPTAGTVAYMPHMSISVPPMPDRNVELRAAAQLQITAGGLGGLLTVISEITSGAAVLLTGSGGGARIGDTAAGAGTAFVGPAELVKKLGPTTVERQFVLGFLMLRDAASALAASVRSSSSGAVEPAYLGAYAT